MEEAKSKRTDKEEGMEESKSKKVEKEEVMEEVKSKKVEVAKEVSTPTVEKQDIDFEQYRLSQDFENMVGIKKEILIVQVRKPDRQVWIWVHPGEEWRMSFALIEMKEDKETYLVSPQIYRELIGECTPKYLFTCQTRQGVIFLWPIKMPGPDGRLDNWNQTALEIATERAGRWIRVVSNMEAGGYEVQTAKAEFPPPVWPPEGFHSLLQKAFRGKIIDTVDHPIVRKLRGQM